MNTSITNIVRAAEWTPLQRLVMLDVVISAEVAEMSSAYSVCDSTATAIAERIGCSVRIASDALHALADAGVLEWRREVHPAGAMNRYGEKIEIRRASKDRGDFIDWQHTSVIAIKSDALAALPTSLPVSTNTDRSRRRAAAERNRVKRIEHALNELLENQACPDCQAVGTIRASIVGQCTSCSQRYRADELDAILDSKIDVNSFHDSAFFPGENFSHDEEDARKEESLTAALPPVAGDELDLDVDHENFSRGESPDLVPERLQGADSIAFLSSISVTGFGKMISRDGQKRGIGTDWLDSPLSESAAVEHLGRSSAHLVGLLPEHGDYDVLDIDAGLSDFFAQHPDARSWCRIIRSDAPDRAKFIIRVIGIRPKYAVRSTENRKIEILTARRSAVIAGIHPDGAAYELVTGRIPTIGYDVLDSILDSFIPKKIETPPIAAAAEVSAGVSTGSTAKRAIAWWCSQPANIAQVEELIEQSRHSASGRHFALRSSEKTPSTNRLNARYVHDHGTGETFDLFDVWLILTDRMPSKRAVVNDVYREWHAAGRP